MSFNEFKSDSHCVGERHRSSTVQIFGAKASKGSKVLIGLVQFVIEKNL